MQRKTRREGREDRNKQQTEKEKEMEKKTPCQALETVIHENHLS